VEVLQSENQAAAAQAAGALWSLCVDNDANKQAIPSASPSLRQFFRGAVDGHVIRYGMNHSTFTAFDVRLHGLQPPSVEPRWLHYLPARYGHKAKSQLWAR
jgi:hypothetical protein